MYFASGQQDYEQATIERNRLQAVRALLERQRVADDRAGTYDAVGGRGRRHRGQRAGLPGPRRRALRPPDLLPRQRGRVRRRARGRGVPAPVLRERDVDPGADRGAGRARRRLRARGAGRDAGRAPRRPGRDPRRRARRQAPHPRPRRAQRAARARPGEAALRAPPPAARGGARRAPEGARGSTRCRCGSSASTSPTSAAPTRSPRWSCSRAARRRSPITVASRSGPSKAATISPRWPRSCARRYAQFEKQTEKSPYDADRDASFAALPNLVVIDGGPGQLSAGLEPLRGFSTAASRSSRSPSGSRRSSSPAAPSRCGSPTTRPSCSCSSACATRPTASRSRTTGSRRDKAMTESIMDELPGHRAGAQARAAEALRLARGGARRAARRARGGPRRAAEGGARALRPPESDRSIELPVPRRDGRVIYVGKAKSIRKRVASHFSARGALQRVRRAASSTSSSRPRPRRCWRSRTSSASTSRASTSACATTSRIPTSRSRSTRTTRGSTSPASATARSAPTSAPTRRPSACAGRSTCSARSSCSAPARGRSRGGARARPASTTTSSAAGRPAWATSRRRSTAPASTA